MYVLLKKKSSSTIYEKKEKLRHIYADLVFEHKKILLECSCMIIDYVSLLYFVLNYSRCRKNFGQSKVLNAFVH